MNKQALDFLEKVGATIEFHHVKDKDGKWKKSDMTNGWLYNVRIKRNGKLWSFKFSDSVHNMVVGEQPTVYDILACITKDEPEDNISDFAYAFGYDIENPDAYRKTKKIYKAVCNEYQNVIRMFGDVMDELCEIY